MNIVELRGDIYSWTVSDISWRLREYKNKAVILRVNSFGGDLNAAMVIAQKIADHGDVTIQYIGLNASAATIVAFGAKKVEMAEDAMWLIHKPLAAVYESDYMNSDDIEDTIQKLQKQKKNLEALDLIVANKYAKKSGKSVKDMLDIMKEERWMTASEVKGLNLVDEIIAASGEIRNHSSLLVQNCIDLKLPLPAFNDSQKNEENDDSFFNRVIEACKEMFAPICKEEKKEDKPYIVKIMNKSYVSINNLLNIEGVEESEGKITLTADQMAAINAALDESAKNKAELDKVTTVLDKFEGNKDIEGVGNKAQSLINIVDKFPTQIVTSVVPAAGTEKTIDGEDPINAIARSI